MAKRPTPKKRREKSRGRTQYSAYVRKQRIKLANRRSSPYALAIVSKRKSGRDKDDHDITTIKA